MKLFLVILLVAVGAVLLLLLRPATPAQQPTPVGVNTATQAARTGTGAARPGVHGAPLREQQGVIESMVDYGTGYTQLKVRQHSKEKLNTLNQGHSAELEQELDR